MFFLYFLISFLLELWSLVVALNFLIGAFPAESKYKEYQ